MTFFQKSTRIPQARRIALAATAALALSLAATTGIAQPAGGMMRGGPGMHGAGVEQMIPQLLVQAKASLNLNTSQQTMWDSVVAQGKAARETGRANHQKVQDAVQAELAKAEPDLAAIAAAADGVEQQNRASRKQVRDQWLALYATFSPEQKAVVRNLLQQKVAQAESFHQRMLQRIQEHLAPSGS